MQRDILSVVYLDGIDSVHVGTNAFHVRRMYRCASVNGQSLRRMHGGVPKEYVAQKHTGAQCGFAEERGMFARLKVWDIEFIDEIKNLTCQWLVLAFHTSKFVVEFSICKSPNLATSGHF